MWNLSTEHETAVGPDRRSRRRKNLSTRQIRVDIGVAAGLVADLSEGGVAVQTPGPLNLNPGDRLHITVPDAARPIQAGCELAWTKPGQAGFRFLVLSENSQRSIREWLTLDAGSGETIWIPAPARPPAATVKSPPPVGNGTTTNKLPETLLPAPPKPIVAAAAAVSVATLVPPPPVAVPAPPKEIAATAVSPLNPRFEHCLQLIAQLAHTLTNASGTAVALRHGNEVICRASAGRAPEMGTTLRSDSGLSGECLRSGMTMRTDDTETDPRVDAAACRALGVRSIVIFPIFYKDSSAGILEVLSDRPQAFDHVDLQLLPQLAELLTRLANKFFAVKEMRKMSE